MKMSPNNIVPFGDRVLIEVLEDTTTYEGIVQLQDSGKEKSNFAKIIAVPKEYNKESAVKVDDIVIYNKYSGSVMTFDRFDSNAPEYRLIFVSDILALVNGN